MILSICWAYNSATPCNNSVLFLREPGFTVKTHVGPFIFQEGETEAQGKAGRNWHKVTLKSLQLSQDRNPELGIASLGPCVTGASRLISCPLVIRGNNTGCGAGTGVDPSHSQGASR